MATARSRFVAENSLRLFFSTHAVFWYWTFTIHDVCDKEEAERRFKPFKDLARRMGAELLYFWELQKRGAWHVHLVIDKRLDVNWLRPWMVERQWGPQMRGVRVQSRWVYESGKGWVVDDRETHNLLHYLIKYLLKSFKEQRYDKKKCFGGSGSAKCGNTLFRWNPKVTGKPGAMFYYYGRQLFQELYDRPPCWHDLTHVIRLGYEVCDWATFDPLYDPP